MKKRVIKGWGRILLIIFCCLGIYQISSAQQKEEQSSFVYLQNESGTPFYVRTGDTLLSSSHAGYLIMPRLAKGDYHFTIGFPKNKLPEASFAIQLKGSGDKGFLIREKDKAFFLYNLQDQSIVKPAQVASSAGNRIVGEPVSKNPQKAEETKKAQDDSASQLLAVLQPEDDAKESQASAKVKPATDKSTAKPAASNPFEEMLNAVTGTEKAPTVAASSTDAEPSEDTVSDLATVPEAEDNSQPTPAEPSPEKALPDEPETPVVADMDLNDKSPETPAMKKTPESNRNGSKAGEQLEFITFIPDTSRQRTPRAKETEPVQAEEPVSKFDSLLLSVRGEKKSHKEKRRVQRPDATEEESRDDLNFLFDTVQTNSDKRKRSASIARPLFPGDGQADPGDSKVVNEKAKTKLPQVAMTNSNCDHMADEQEFEKARRKVAAQKDDNSMYRRAEKYFIAGICYSTSQIRSIAYLFTTDEYRYKFLEMAYAHAADSDQYTSLLKTLSSDYYRGRFEAMVR